MENKKGLLLTCSYEDLDIYLNKYDFDIKLHITQYTNQGIKVDFLHTPQLAPSPELFAKTMNVWKKFKFSDEDLNYLKSIHSNDWFDLYRRDYLKQIETDYDMQRYIKRVCKRLDEGKNIIMCCYCKNIDKCHRKILGEYFRQLGYEVIIK